MILGLLVLSVLFLAGTNGANDNFKGVATLYGSRTVGYKTALTIATLSTLAGSATALILARGLIASFSGKGLVPTETAGATGFLFAVGTGAALTVLLATRVGLPISTTHALVGGLVGAGIPASGGAVDFSRLLQTFLIPLMVSPFLAFAGAAVLYGIFSKVRQSLGWSKESCLCVGETRQLVPVTTALHRTTAMQSEMSVMVSHQKDCIKIYSGRMFGISLQKLLDIAHTMSAAVVSFARGLNDTPKIAGLMVAVTVLDIRWGIAAIALAMAIGGLIGARRVAETMSHRITELNRGQGFTANLVTGLLVIVASRFGIPVSTTHVSVGSIFGIGTVRGDADKNVSGRILLSWAFTLPVAAACSALAYLLVRAAQ